MWTITFERNDICLKYLTLSSSHLRIMFFRSELTVSGQKCFLFTVDSETEVQKPPALYLECSVRGCNGRAGRLGDGSRPARSRTEPR